MEEEALEVTKIYNKRKHNLKNIHTTIKNKKTKYEAILFNLDRLFAFFIASLCQ
jgi:hypothetical protein